MREPVREPRNTEIERRVEAASEAVVTFHKALSVTEFTVPELVAAGLLPATFLWSRIEDARRRVTDDIPDGDRWRVIAAYLPQLEMFTSTLDRSGRQLGQVIELAMTLRRDLNAALSLPLLVPKLAGLIDFTAVVAGRPIKVPGVGIESFPSGKAKDNESWEKELKRLENKLSSQDRKSLDELLQSAWRQWAIRMSQHLSGGKSEIFVPSYEDLVLAATDPISSTLLYCDLGKMTVAEWTRVCLLGAETAAGGVGKAPGWTCCAALVALRFGLDIVRRVEEDLRPVWGYGAPALKEFLPIGLTEMSPAPNAIGPLIIALGESPPPVASRPSTRPYLLVVDRGVLMLYHKALAWLKSHGVFNEVIGEI
jgi:hypothetical protein